MSRLSDVVNYFEAMKVDTGPTLSMFARRLREAGRISKAKRGRGAADMTYLDGARFLIATFSTDRPEQAVDAEATFSNTVIHGGGRGLPDVSTVGPLGFLMERIQGEDMPFDQALALILEDLGSGALRDRVRAAARGDLKTQLINSYQNFEIIFQRSHVLIDLRFHDIGCRFGSPIYREMDRRAEGYLAQPSLEDLAGEVEADVSVMDMAIGRFKTGKNIHAVASHDLIGPLAQLIAQRTSYA